MVGWDRVAHGVGRLGLEGRGWEVRLGRGGFGLAL